MSSNKEWMHLRLTNGLPNQSFISGVEEFVQFALSRPEGSDGNHIRCPCNRRNARIRILLRLTRQGSIFINTVLSLIIVCGTCMVRPNRLYMGMRH